MTPQTVFSHACSAQLTDQKDSAFCTRGLMFLLVLEVAPRTLAVRSKTIDAPRVEVDGAATTFRTKKTAAVRQTWSCTLPLFTTQITQNAVQILYGFGIEIVGINFHIRVLCPSFASSGRWLLQITFHVVHPVRLAMKCTKAPLLKFSILITAQATVCAPLVSVWHSPHTDSRPRDQSNQNQELRPRLAAPLCALQSVAACVPGYNCCSCWP